MICPSACFFLNLSVFNPILTAGGSWVGLPERQAEAVCVSECPAAVRQGRTCRSEDRPVRQGLHPWTRAWASAPLHPRLWASCPKTPVQPSAGCIPPAPGRAGPTLKEPCSLRTQRRGFRSPAPSILAKPPAQKPRFVASGFKMLLHQRRKWQAPIPEWCLQHLKMTTRAREMLRSAKPEIATTGNR